MKKDNTNYYCDEFFHSIMELDIDENQYINIEEDLTDIEKQQLKKSLKKGFNKKNTGRKVVKVATIGTLVLASGIFFSKPVFAEKIEILSDIYEAFGYYKNYKDYTEYIGMSKEDNGFTVTIEKLLVTEKKIITTFTVESEKDLPSYYSIFPSASMSGVWASGSSVYNDRIDDKTLRCYVESYAEDSFPKRGELNIGVSSAYVSDDHSTQFNISIDGIKIDATKAFKDSVTIDINKEENIDNNYEDFKKVYGDNFKFEKIYSSIAGTQITATSVGLKNLEKDFSEDEKAIWYSRFAIFVKVDEDLYYCPGGSRDDDDNITFNLDSLSSQRIKKAKSISIIPVKTTGYNKEVFSYEEVMEKTQYAEENGIRYAKVSYKQDDIPVFITKVEKGKDEVKVYYNSQGEERIIGDGIYTFTKLYDGSEIPIINLPSKIYKNTKGKGYVKVIDISSLGNKEFFIDYYDYNDIGIYEIGEPIEVYTK